jgi:RimJ/RimL family protein N-acetyltransferase
MDVFVGTDRLVLRRLTEADVDDLVELDSDPEVMRYINGGEPSPRDYIENVLLPVAFDHYRRFDGCGRWAAVERSTGEFIGWFALRPPRARVDEVEIGYRLRRASWGKGYATEGSRALIRKTFTERDSQRVFAEIMALNHGSRRVMEKLGLTLVRTFHPDYADYIDGAEHGDVEYALRRTDWDPTANRR